MRAHPTDDVIRLMVYEHDQIEPVRIEDHSLDDPGNRFIDSIVDVRRDEDEVVVTGEKHGDQIEIRIRSDDLVMVRLSDLNRIPLSRLL
jgi:hypothetical protein